MNFADLPQSLFAQNHSSEHHRIGETNIQHLWVALEDPFLHRKPAFYQLLGPGSHSQEGLWGKQGRVWEKPTGPFPSVHGDGPPQLNSFWGFGTQLGKKQGEALAKSSRTAAFCLTFLNGTLNFFSRICMDIRRNRNATVKNSFFIVEKKHS